jgi:sRNA-binding regulator protein Hfq
MAKRITSEPDPNQISLLASAATAAAVLEEPMTNVAPSESLGAIGTMGSIGSANAPINAKLPQPDKLAPPSKRTRIHTSPASVRHHIAISSDDHGSNHQAELFYLQKQIQQQTQMIFILEDGSRIQGIVEWYDRSSIKVRGKSRVLIYKSAIKYLYKAGEVGSAPGVQA